MKTFFCEATKLFTIKKTAVVFAAIFTVCFLFGIAEKSLTASNPPADFAAFTEMNRGFIIVKILYPIMISYLVNIIITGEYESGLTKNFLIFGIRRAEYLLCKIIIVILCAFFVIIIIYISLMITYLTVWKGAVNFISADNYLQTAAAVIPVISATALISVTQNSFTKAVFVSIGTLLISFTFDSVIGENIITPTSFMSFGNLLGGTLYSIILLIPSIIIFKNKDIWQ